jgi:RNA polymerase sigma-70 factor (sigma-E family)
VVRVGGSFDEVYDREYVGLVQLAHLLTGSEAAGEDLVQEAFAVALGRWDRLGNPAAYVRTSVVNGARQRHRRRAVEARLGSRVASPLAVEGDAAAGAELWDALARLPFRQRAALVLRFYEDRTAEEIATALGCRPATARSLLHRGTAALRKVIER